MLRFPSAVVFSQAGIQESLTCLWLHVCIVCQQLQRSVCPNLTLECNLVSPQELVAKVN